MSTARRVIVNELGNIIPISVTCDHRGVTITASGPHSEVEHTWTPLEFATIQDLFMILLDFRDDLASDLA